jgi:hypothetical protein
MVGVTATKQSGACVWLTCVTEQDKPVKQAANHLPQTQYIEQAFHSNEALFGSCNCTVLSTQEKQGTFGMSRAIVAVGNKAATPPPHAHP